MDPRKSTQRRDTVLALLTNLEIDGFVVAQLRSIEGSAALLTDIAAGRVKASAYQRRNAAYVLGRLGEQGAVPTLVSILRTGDRALRLSAVVALAAIDLDAEAQGALTRFAEDKGTDAVEAVYAREAVQASRHRIKGLRLR
jgi:HEAT repeat protein